MQTEKNYGKELKYGLEYRKGRQQRIVERNFYLKCLTLCRLLRKCPESSVLHQFLLWNLIQSNEDNRYLSWQHMPLDMRSSSSDNYLIVTEEGSHTH